MILAVLAIFFAGSAWLLAGSVAPRVQSLAGAPTWGSPALFVARFRAAFVEPRRRQRFAAQLAGLLDLIAGALRSGSSLATALQAAAEDSAEPAASHFAQVSQQLQLGAEPEAALDGLAALYAGSVIEEELRMLATTVAVTRSTGGNLAELLSALAETLRERQRLRAEIDSMTAQGRMSGLIVGALPFLLLLVLSFLDPGLVEPMFTTTTGILLLALGLALELIGALLIRRIVSIDL